jgi:hypothetical protein
MTLQRSHLEVRRIVAATVRGRVSPADRERLTGVGSIPPTPQNVLALQRIIGNQAIQRWLGAQGTNQKAKGEKVPVTFDQEFVDKHIAATVGQAKTKTLGRINNGDAPQSMKEGNMGNTVATEAAWKAAIDASTDVLPPEGKWEPSWGDDGERIHNLGVTISGWEVTRDGPVAQSASAKEISGTKRSIGGNWTVTNNDVAADVDHMSTRGV